jgi:hypothetical protein
MSGLDGNEDMSVVPDENGKGAGHQQRLAGALEHSPGNPGRLPANAERLLRSLERLPAAIERGLPDDLE